MIFTMRIRTTLHPTQVYNLYLRLSLGSGSYLCHSRRGLSLKCGALLIHVLSFLRWLISQGREDEALKVLSEARGLPPDNDLVQIEYLSVHTDDGLWFSYS